MMLYCKEAIFLLLKKHLNILRELSKTLASDLQSIVVDRKYFSLSVCWPLFKEMAAVENPKSGRC